MSSGKQNTQKASIHRAHENSVGRDVMKTAPVRFSC